MKPGKELNLLIAELVFGADIKRRETFEEIIYPDGTIFPLPNYSTDRSSAMDVVAEINRMNSLVQHKFYQLYDGFDFQEIKLGEKIKEMRIDPFEICVAALEALKLKPKT